MTAFPKPVKREPRPRKELRRSWIKRRKPRRLTRAGSDPAYLAWVKTQPCLAQKYATALCRRPIHAHHAGRRPGVAMKADDSTAIPLCELHHADWHNAGGVFRGLTKLQRFAWSMRAIAETQATYRGAALRGMP